MTIEYRVKPVVRYFVTRHESAEDGSGSLQNFGSEYANGETAYEVGYALAKAEAERLGLPVGSTELIFPQQPIQYELKPHPVYGVEELVFSERPPSPYTDAA
jgi:hypothetical protein